MPFQLYTKSDVVGTPCKAPSPSSLSFWERLQQQLSTQCTLSSCSPRMWTNMVGRCHQRNGYHPWVRACYTMVTTISITMNWITVDSAWLHYISAGVSSAIPIHPLWTLRWISSANGSVFKFLLARMDFTSENLLVPFRGRTVLYWHELYAHLSSACDGST